MPLLDLDAYRERIGFDGPLDSTIDTLRRLHRHQATTIPYENLDLHLGRPIVVDLPSIERKLVHGHRGGYCFEQNGLLAGVLEQIGFTVLRVAARVRRGPGEEVRPRTHMALVVTVGGQRWLSDVGFGGATPLDPIPLVPGRVSRQGVWGYRVHDESGIWVLQTWEQGSWTDLYAFSEEPQLQPDIEMANHYTSTHPSSRFVHVATAQLPGPRAQRYLRSQVLETIRPGSRTVRTLRADELLGVLAAQFGLRFAPGTRFFAPAVGGGPGLGTVAGYPQPGSSAVPGGR